MRIVLSVALFSFVLAGFGLAGGAAGHAQSAQPVVRAVLFRADWCPNCHVLEPEFDKALRAVADQPIEEVVLDFTNSQTWDESVNRALDHDVVSVYNGYAPSTGFVVLVAADTGEPIDCLDRRFSYELMAETMRRAVQRVHNQPRGKRSAQSALCPTPRAPA